MRQRVEAAMFCRKCRVSKRVWFEFEERWGSWFPHVEDGDLCPDCGVVLDFAPKSVPLLVLDGGLMEPEAA